MKNQNNIKKEFFQSLKAGIGKAYFIQLANPLIDFSEEIIKGATKNYAYDPQSEGSRAKYIYRLICQAPKPHKIQQAVLKKLLNKKNNWYDLDQLFDLAVLFYQNGNKKAKKAIRKRFKMNARAEGDFVGEKQLMAIDGVKGVLKVAKLAGKRLVKDKEDYESSWLVDRFQQKNRGIDLYALLEERAERNVYIKKYLESIRDDKAAFCKIKQAKRYSYKYIKGRIENGRFKTIGKKQANQLRKKEVKKLAKAFAAERNLAKKEGYLRFFAVRKYPNDVADLLAIVTSPNPKKTRIVEFAAEALQYFKSDEVRRVALKKIKRTKDPAIFLPLLTSNYQAGDHMLLEEVLDRSSQQDFIHSLVDGLITIYTFNKTTACKGPLMRVYEQMTCGIHRYDILVVLQENNALTKAVLREMKYDSSSEVRRLFRETVYGG